MPNLPVFFTLLFIVSYAFAKVEIAIEGSVGWAESLPTWRLDKKHWASKLFLGGRPVTGYHASVMPFVFFLLHAVYIFQPFGLKTELAILSFYFLFWILEDFLWFLLNPAFGLKNFKKEKIWWHQHSWWGIAPREYFIFTPLALVLLYFSRV